MDRFIDSLAGAWYGYGRNLKSNMDRFIVLFNGWVASMEKI